MQNLCRTLDVMKWKISMSRISKVQKQDVSRYAWRKNISPIIADSCNTREEVDAVQRCMVVIKQNVNKYHHAVSLAPHDTKGRMKAINKLLSNAKNPQEKNDIMLEWSAVSPVKSQTKAIKNNVLDICKIIMKNSGIGIHRRDRIIPLLTWHLTDDDELLQKPDENLQKLLNKIKSF